MKKTKKLAFVLFFGIFTGQITSAQMTKRDSLRKVMLSKDLSPEHRKRAWAEFGRIQREQMEADERARPQGILLRESALRLEMNSPQQDSLANKQ